MHKALLLLCSCFALSSALPRSNGSPSSGVLVRQDVVEEASSDWDWLIFTVQWPVTTCMEWQEKEVNHTCILPVDPHLWTIHGLWPTKSRTMGPAFCNASWEFDIQQVQPILPDLMKLWPNIHGGDKVDSLWKHEWSKHGTCAALDPHFANESLYFSKSLELAKKFKVQDILTAHNIVPSYSILYRAVNVWQALRDAVGFDPAISCELDKKSGAFYISEIKLCFSRDLELMDCDPLSAFSMDNIKLSPKKTAASMLLGNCPTKKLVYYPGAAHPKTYSSNLHVQPHS